MGLNVAPVVTAEVLLRHGMSEDVAAAYLARTWRLRDSDCRAAIDAAHILLRRERVCSTAPIDRERYFSA